MEFKARVVNWSKRRRSDPTRKIKTIFIPDFKYIHYHNCKVHVDFEDIGYVSLQGRVLQNSITKKWTVDAHDENYNSAIIEVIE